MYIDCDGIDWVGHGFGLVHGGIDRVIHGIDVERDGIQSAMAESIGLGAETSWFITESNGSFTELMLNVAESNWPWRNRLGYNIAFIWQKLLSLKPIMCLGEHR